MWQWPALLFEQNLFQLDRAFKQVIKIRVLTCARASARTRKQHPIFDCQKMTVLYNFSPFRIILDHFDGHSFKNDRQFQNAFIRRHFNVQYSQIPYPDWWSCLVYFRPSPLEPSPSISQELHQHHVFQKGPQNPSFLWFLKHVSLLLLLLAPQVSQSLSPTIAYAASCMSTGSDLVRLDYMVLNVFSF